jgi:quercetin dioxygenase-like cupin family protein
MRAVLLAGALVVVCAGFIPTAAQDKPIVWPAADLKWVDNPAVKGAQQAILWGDPARGAYGALKRIPAGTSLPMHLHSNETRALLFSGTLSFSFEGTPAKDLGPQSYVSVPAGMRHAATCKPGTDCVYFETSTGAYDVKLQ